MVAGMNEEIRERWQPAGRNLTSANLKNTAILTMLIDHIGAALLEPLYYSLYSASSSSAEMIRNIDSILRTIGRLSFPLFIFLIVEGFFYTHSRARYLIRLSLFSLISEFPFDLAFHAGDIHWDRGQNVFFTLALGFAAMWAVERIRPWPGIPVPRRAEAQSGQLPAGAVLPETEADTCQGQRADDRADAVLPETDAGRDHAQGAEDAAAGKRPGRAAAAVRIAVCLAISAVFCLMAEWLNTDYGWSGVLAILIAYLIRSIGMQNLELFGMLAPLVAASPVEAAAVFDQLLIMRYHGEKGHGWNRWFYYLFYPCHLLILGLIRVLILKV